MKLVTSAQMRELEQRAVTAGISESDLMSQAGLAVAQEVWLQLGHVEQRRILVLVGPGNNGGDALVTARQLAEWGATVLCYALRARDDAQWRSTMAAGITGTNAPADPAFTQLDAWLADAEMTVDGLLGTGRSRPLEGALAAILQRLSAARARRPQPGLVAVDLPSGLDADSGAVDPLTVTPDETVTFQYPKVGLYTQPGAAHAGQIEIVDIGIPAGPEDDHLVELLDRRTARALLPARPANAHKGSFGRVLVLAGSANYPGAAILAASAAYRAGAGLVTLATAASLVGSLVAAMPEVTYLPLEDGQRRGALDATGAPDLHRALPQYDALVVGCGLGRDPATASLVRQLLRDSHAAHLRAIVIDADGLNALTAEAWSEEIVAPFILTPHPGEMARLLKTETAEVQQQRLELAQSRAASWGGTVVLKGANTVVAGADGRARLSPVAQSALATAGTGDVLAGAIGGLVAQGMDPFNAASLGVYLHANAGERAGRARGSAGTTAQDVLSHLALAGRSLAGEEPAGGMAGADPSLSGPGPLPFGPDAAGPP